MLEVIKAFDNAVFVMLDKHPRYTSSTLNCPVVSIIGGFLLFGLIFLPSLPAASFLTCSVITKWKKYTNS